jgi:hypothetical protein
VFVLEIEDRNIIDDDCSIEEFLDEDIDDTQLLNVEDITSSNNNNNNIDKTMVVCEWHIVYSISFQVPTLYFNISQLGNCTYICACVYGHAI